LSFEVFPPVRDGRVKHLFSVIDRLAKLNPDFISVTYGAGGSTRDMSVEIASSMKKSGTAEVLAHLTCVGASKGEILTVLDKLKASNIKNVLALRGDPPAGEDVYKKHEDGFDFACGLVEFIRQYDHFCIGVAGYPEGHTEATSLKADIDNLRKKVAAGSDFIITQLFFDNDDFYRFRDCAAKADIDIPIIPGIFPIFNYRQIQKIASLSSARIPEALHKKIHAARDRNDLAEQYGIEYALKQSEDLIKNGVSGLHFYTMNRSSHVEKIVRNLPWQRG
ncbi:MAG: methylenetetrahydrofolate reductase [NAD(P)H], partial [Deltaproteobacteria bacterium]|nr:methylenetetrahydrofolate reductase [NAD(P)H] [Deltaproteobacteria bacterium]